MRADLWVGYACRGIPMGTPKGIPMGTPKGIPMGTHTGIHMGIPMGMLTYTGYT